MSSKTKYSVVLNVDVVVGDMIYLYKCIQYSI